MTEIMLQHAPSDWSRKRLGQLFRERREKVSDKDFPALSVTKQGILPQLETAAKSDDGDNRKGVRAGDFVINSRSDRKGSGGLSDRDGSVSLINIVLQPRDVEPRFAHHLLRSPAFQEEFYRWGHGIVADLWTTRYSEMKNILLAVPDRLRQIAIADFLDRETARIDQLIKKKQYQIDLLEEQFRSEIHKVVCKGLQSEFPTKDSGLRWFGHVPRHWQMKPLRHVLLFQRGHDLPSDERIAGNVPVVSSGGSSSVHDVSVAEAPGIVTGRYGTIGSFYFIEEPYWPLNTTLYSKRLFEEPRYVWYLLQEISHIFILNSSKSAVPGIDRNDLHSEYVPVPPKEEQILAVRHLEVKRTLKERLSLLVEESIDGLREFRSSLITAAVTGQIDVTTWGKEGEAARRLDKIEEAMQA